MRNYFHEVADKGEEFKAILFKLKRWQKSVKKLHFKKNRHHAELKATQREKEIAGFIEKVEDMIRTLRKRGGERKRRQDEV